MKKLFAVILSLSMIICSLFTATTALAEEECNITFSDATLMAGTSVDIAVYLNNNPGIGGIRLTLSLPEGFSHKTKSEGGITGGSLFSDFDYGKNVIFMDTQDVTDDGLLMTIHLDVDETVSAGEYEISAILRQCIDTHGSTIDCEIIPGTVTVEAEIPVQGITLDQTEVTLREGETVTLHHTIIPANATEQGVTWKTSRKAVATVSGGVVTAVGIGTATITVKSNYVPPSNISTGGGGNGLPIIPLDSGFKATCKVTVLCGHINTATTTAQENYTLPTHSDNGGYDTVTYCNKCGGEVSRVHHQIAATGLTKNYVNITMEGDIGVNAFLDLSAFNLDNFRVEIKSVDTDGSEITATYENPSKEGAGEFANFYKFTTEVAAHNMVKDIIITLYNGDNIVTDFGDNGSYITSIRDIQEQYIEYYSQGDGASDPKASQIVSLCKAYLAYGARAQTYFKVDTDDLADKNYSIAEQVTAVTADDIDSVRTISGAATGFKIVSSTFMVTSKSAIRFYYQLTDTSITDYTFSATLDGESAKVRTGTNNAGLAFVEVYDIAAKDLDAQTVLNVTNNNDNSILTVSYNAMCYAKSMIANSTNSAIVEICKAMYLYNKAANEYFTD